MRRDDEAEARDHLRAGKYDNWAMKSSRLRKIKTKPFAVWLYNRLLTGILGLSLSLSLLFLTPSLSLSLALFLFHSLHVLFTGSYTAVLIRVKGVSTQRALYFEL